jgi:hypothetical protein
MDQFNSLKFLILIKVKYALELMNNNMRFEVFMMVKMPIVTFQVFILCSLVGGYKHFRVTYHLRVVDYYPEDRQTYHLHLQDRSTLLCR